MFIGDVEETIKQGHKYLRSTSGYIVMISVMALIIKDYKRQWRWHMQPQLILQYKIV